MLKFMNGQPVTSEEVDRILGIGDQFLKDWAIEAVSEHRDPDYEERQAEWEVIRPLLVAAPELLAACEEFVRKCENGEAKSTRSYAQMKAAIAKSKGGAA